MNTLNTIFVVLGGLGALAALGIYGLSQPWWRTQIGRFLVSQAGVLSLVYLESVVRSILHVKFPDWVLPATNGAVALLMLWHAFVFATTIRRARRTRHAREDSDTSQIGETP